jgi:hypothetical protein
MTEQEPSIRRVLDNGFGRGFLIFNEQTRLSVYRTVGLVEDERDFLKGVWR